MDQPTAEIDLEQRATELYQLLGHQVEETIQRGSLATDLVIRAKTGDKWLARCASQLEVNGMFVWDFIQLVHAESARQAAILTAGQFSPEAKRLAQQASVHLVDGAELKRYLQQAHTLAEQRVPSAKQKTSPKTPSLSEDWPTTVDLGQKQTVTVVPPEPRYSVEETGDGLRVIIPSKKNQSLLFYDGLVLLIGVIAASSLLSSGYRDTSSSSFVLILYLMALFVLVGGVSLLLWLLKGNEVIEVDQNRIKVQRQVQGVGRTSEYIGKFIYNLRAAPIVYPMPRRRALLDRDPPEPTFAFEFLGLAGGQIAFEHLSKTVRFGASLDEVEARMLVDTILQRFPHYCRRQQDSLHTPITA